MPELEIALQTPESAPYRVWIEPAALAGLGEAVRAVAPAARCALFADPEVFALHGEAALGSLRAAGYDPVQQTLPPGEANKTLETVRGLWQALLEHRLDRSSPVIALGGGVTGDMVGFAAATYLRGVPVVQVPTTLLAMVDSSVGGKTGFNTPEGKNLIGAFHQPALVVCDPELLATLPDRELGCGLAECLKHAVIRDPELFARTRAALPKLRARDPRGVRAHLNFGHTFAHAIEAVVGYGEILHGEAVGLGMIAATATATARGSCDAALVDDIRAAVGEAGLPTETALPSDAELDAAMRMDKKVTRDRVRFVLPTRLGSVEIRDDVAPDQVASGWARIRA
jgi:3-dehydroquinate synthase